MVVSKLHGVPLIIGHVRLLTKELVQHIHRFFTNYLSKMRQYYCYLRIDKKLLNIRNVRSLLSNSKM